MKGTIKKLVGDRGFGFIVTEEGDEIFFHRSGLKEVEFETLKEGAAVEFDREQSEKGPRAANVTLSA